MNFFALLIVTAELRSLSAGSTAGNGLPWQQIVPQAPSPSALKAVARAELRSLAAALRKTKGRPERPWCQTADQAAAQPVEAASGRRLEKRPFRRPMTRCAARPMPLRASAVPRRWSRRRAGSAAAGTLMRPGGSSRRPIETLMWPVPPRRAAPQAAGQAIKAAAEIVGGLRLEARRSAGHRGGLSRHLPQGPQTARSRLFQRQRGGPAHGAQACDPSSSPPRPAARPSPHPARRIAALEKLREALGDLNDLDELCQLAADGKASLPDSAARAMAKRRAMLLKRAEKAAGRLFRHKPKAFQKRIGAMWAPAQA